jgi:hypothetical protein
MKTAVEWLIDELKNKHGIQTELYSEFEQAKVMEEDARHAAYLYGHKVGFTKAKEQEHGN